MAQKLRGFTRKFLSTHFKYNPKTGLITRKTDRAYHAKKGEVVGTEKNGYLSVKINGVHILLHRLAYFLKTGKVSKEIDHKDRNGINNRWKNLRPTIHLYNGKNRTLNKNSTTGIKGVTFYKRLGKYVAKIRVNYQLLHLGYFDCPKKAEKAYKRAAKKYFGEMA